MKNIKVQRKKLSDYKPDLKNANSGSERGYRMIDDSITGNGVGRSGLVDKNGVIIAGNQTMQVLAANGIEDVIEIETTGNEWVIVKRTDTDLADSDPNNTARRLAYEDNRSGQENLTWNPVQLQADREAGIEIVDKLWSPVELDVFGASINVPIMGNDVVSDYVRDANSLHMTKRNVGDGKMVNMTFGDIQVLLPLDVYQMVADNVNTSEGDISTIMAKILERGCNA